MGLMCVKFIFFVHITYKNNLVLRLPSNSKIWMVFILHRKSPLFAEFRVSWNSTYQDSERNVIPQKNVFKMSSMCFSLSLNGSLRISKGFLFCLIFRYEILNIFLFCEMVQKGILGNFIFAIKLRSSSVFLFYKMVLNGFPSILIFRRMVRNKITKFWVFFSFKKEMVRNWIPSLFIFRGMARNRISSVSVPWNRRNSDGMTQIFRLFRFPRNNFS